MLSLKILGCHSPYCLKNQACPSYLLSDGVNNILLDCGMHQSNDRYKDFLTNNRRPKEYKPQDVDLVFISHPHLDHVGLLPLLFKRGCECGVVVAEKNKNIMNLMLSDCANINERDILVINSQNNKSYDALYSQKDVDRTLQHIKEFPTNEKRFRNNV
jgi:Cft2 family RNA processing exonuclease